MIQSPPRKHHLEAIGKLNQEGEVEPLKDPFLVQCVLHLVSKLKYVLAGLKLNVVIGNDVQKSSSPSASIPCLTNETDCFRRQYRW